MRSRKKIRRKFKRKSSRKIKRRALPALTLNPALNRLPNHDLHLTLSSPRTARTTASRNSGRTIAAVLGFLILFAILVIMVSKLYLIPGLEMAQHATHAHRRKMAAQALLLLVVMLTILLAGLLITFRISRFFFPAPTSARTRTKVVDAWAEAGKRMDEGKKDSPDEP